MIPDYELETNVSTVADAITLACAGEVADGYACLVAGKSRVEQAQEDGAPWAAELLYGYQIALDKYVERYGFPARGENG